MPLSDQKTTLAQMFSPRDVTKARVQELLELEDLKARVALTKLYTDLVKARAKGQDVGNFISQIDIFYTPAAIALDDRLSSAGYTQAEISAALMVADGHVKLE